MSCEEPNSGKVKKKPVPGDGNTAVYFDNTDGIAEAIVYRNYPREEYNIAAKVPAGKASPEIPWSPSEMYSFYFSYNINIKDITGFSINYVPAQLELNQVAVRIDRNKTTRVAIPRLEETISPDSLLSGKSYLLIQNHSSFSFSLVGGIIVVPPDNLSSTTVNARESAQYTIDAGPVANYKLNVSGTHIPFSTVLDRFEPGFVYSLTVEGAS